MKRVIDETTAATRRCSHSAIIVTGLRQIDLWRTRLPAVPRCSAPYTGSSRLVNTACVGTDVKKFRVQERLGRLLEIAGGWPTT